MSLFGTDGIRGRAGEGPLAPAAVRRLGAVIGRLVSRAPDRFRTPARIPADDTPFCTRAPGNILVGRDPRASGPSIEEALVEGFNAAGLHVVRAGVVPTPAVAMLTRRCGFSLGVMISASHNPAGDNGIKLIGPNGLKVPDGAEEAVEDLFSDASFRPSRKRSAGSDDGHVMEALYSGALMETVGAIGSPRIVIDCAHGATSEPAPAILSGAGARVTTIHAAPDGTNINRGCGAVHPGKLAARVRRERADLGVAFDGDGDRAIFVDERGTIRDGDDVLFLAARWMRGHRALRAATVVGTGMTNFGLELEFRRRRIALRRAPVGDRFVAEEMLRSGAVLGGEPSGHIIDFHRTTTGDGILTALLLLRILAEGKGSFSRQAAGWRRLPQLIENVRVGRKPPLEEVPAVIDAVEEARRVLEGRGRLLVRYSGTEPLLRIMVEGPDALEVKDLARRLREAAERHLRD